MTPALPGGGRSPAVPPSPPPGGATVGSAMVRRPRVCDAGTTVAQVREAFQDDHVHAVLVAEKGLLLAVVEREDVQAARPDVPAREIGTLAGRVVGPDADLAEVWHAMRAASRRRLAVADPSTLLLLGLLCLRRTGQGFCSDADVAARAAELGRRMPPAVTVPRGGRDDA